MYCISISNGLYNFVHLTASVPGIPYLVRLWSRVSASTFCAGSQFWAAKMECHELVVRIVQPRTLAGCHLSAGMLVESGQVWRHTIKRQGPEQILVRGCTEESFNTKYVVPWYHLRQPALLPVLRYIPCRLPYDKPSSTHEGNTAFIAHTISPPSLSRFGWENKKKEGAGWTL